MKTISFTREAARDLRTYAAERKRIVAKLEAYAATGAGDVKDLVGLSGKRLRAGAYRVIFEETATEIVVTKIGPRGTIYD